MSLALGVGCRLRGLASPLVWVWVWVQVSQGFSLLVMPAVYTYRASETYGHETIGLALGKITLEISLNEAGSRFQRET